MLPNGAANVGGVIRRGLGDIKGLSRSRRPLDGALLGRGLAAHGDDYARGSELRVVALATLGPPLVPDEDRSGGRAQEPTRNEYPD